MPGPSIHADRRILVVDDESGIREVCQRSLVGLGYRVDTAENGDKALSLFGSQDFDLVFTDITMPGVLNGVKLLEAIKLRSPTTDVVIMTGFPSHSTAIPALKNGAYDYLIKPFDLSFFLALVDRCFEKRRLSDELNREKIMRQELQAAYAELQKVEKTKESFLSRLNHELRTPFVSVFFVLDQIELDPENGKFGSVLKTLRSHISNVWNLLENLLLFTDLRQNSQTLYRVPIEPKTMLKDIVNTYRIESQRKELSVELTVDGNAESIEGDPQLV